MIVISLFNHKGGVSKTTTTFNLAWKLTEFGKKVMIVDGDPQCNMTGLFLGYDNFYDYYDDTKTAENNIKDAVSMAFQGRPAPITAVDCPSHINNDSLYLLPGHMDLSEYESSLSFALTSNNALLTLQNLPGAIYNLIKLCSDRECIDYVFIDMNPGLSALNQVFFMYSDYFIVPTNPDPFSVMALNTLKTTLPRWKKLSKQAMDISSDSSYPFPSKNMEFIGEIIQRFNLRNGEAAKPYKNKIQEIKSFVEDKFVDEMKKNGMLADISRSIVDNTLSDRCIGEISDFGSLIQRANDTLKPVFALNRDDMRADGKVYENMETKREMINLIFDKMAKVVLETTK